MPPALPALTLLRPDEEEEEEEAAAAEEAAWYCPRRLEGTGIGSLFALRKTSPSSHILCWISSIKCCCGPITLPGLHTRIQPMISLAVKR